MRVMYSSCKGQAIQTDPVCLQL